MIFGLVTFLEVKSHPPPLKMSVIYQAMTCLIFVHEVGKLGDGCGCEVPTDMYCGYFIMKKQFGNMLSYM